MKEIILIVVIFGLFIFFIWAFLKPQKKAKVEPKVEKEKAKDEPPAILKEVTMGNYMYEMSQNTTVDGVEIVEDGSLELPKQENNKTKIEKAFDEINDIGDDYGEDIDIEVDEIDDYVDIVYDAVEDLDDEILINESNVNAVNNVKRKQSLTEEYRGLSKEMKAMLIANILEKKHKK